MSVTVKVFGSGQRGVQELDVGGTVLDVMASLGLSTQEYIAARAGEVVPIDEPVADGDSLTLVKIISGG